MKLLQRLIILLIVFSSTNVLGQAEQETDSLWTGRKFRISPYFWYIGLKGTIYKPPQPTNFPEPVPPKFDIDVGFKDIKNSIKFAWMMSGHYRGEDVVVQFNMSTLTLESEAITPLELVLTDNIVRFTHVAGDLGVGYRIVRNPRIQVDGLLGLKFVYFKIGLNTNVAGEEVEGSRARAWYEPVVGVNVLYRPMRKIELVGYADYGGKVFNNNITYQAAALFNFHFTRTFFLSLGYRTYYVDFTTEEDVIYSGNLKGWIMKIGFEF